MYRKLSLLYFCWCCSFNVTDISISKPSLLNSKYYSTGLCYELGAYNSWKYYIDSWTFSVQRGFWSNHIYGRLWKATEHICKFFMRCCIYRYIMSITKEDFFKMCKVLYGEFGHHMKLWIDCSSGLYYACKYAIPALPSTVLREKYLSQIENAHWNIWWMGTAWALLVKILWAKMIFLYWRNLQWHMCVISKKIVRQMVDGAEHCVWRLA